MTCFLANYIIYFFICFSVQGLTATQRTKMITDNLDLVKYFANKCYPGKVTDDLSQEGTYGLIKAVDKYDPEKGVKLSTYSSYWIRSYMSVYASKNTLIPIPKKKQKIVSKPSIMYVDAFSDYISQSILSTKNDNVYNDIILEILNDINLSEEELVQIKNKLYNNWSYKYLGQKP